MGWYSLLFKNFPQFVVIHIVNVFNIVSEAEVDAFLEFTCFSHDPEDVGSWISDSSAFSQSTLYIWYLSVHISLNPNMMDFENDLASI